MQNYVSLNIDYVDFNNTNGSLGGGGSGISLGGRESIGEREKREKREKNEKSEQNTNNTNNTNKTNNISEVVYKTIVMPFYIPLVDYVISNDLFIEIIDSLNKNQTIGEGKIRKYRLNGPPTNYDMFIETEKENVYHVKKRGIMMRVKVSGDQYKVIVKMLTSMNGGGVGDANTTTLQNQIILTPSTSSTSSKPHNVLIKKKTGFLNWFACFRAT
jgi:hypothetical protein